MSEYKLQASRRDPKEDLEETRKAGKIPAVIYGKGKENINLSLDGIAFRKVFTKAGENSLVDLEIDGEAKPKNVLIHDLQMNPVTDQIIHIDFYEVRMDEEVETEVPLKFVGESPAVKDLEGTLLTNKTEVEVKCLPANIPHEIEVDISKIATFEDNILAKDLKIPNGVELLTDLEEVIALVNPPRSEEELKELEGEVVENVEAVEATEEKKEEEGEANEVKEEGKKEEPKAEAKQ